MYTAGGTAQQEYRLIYFNRLGEKRFVSVVSDVVVALYRHCVTAAL